MCVFGCVWAVSACPVRCSRGRTIAPTPVGEALMLSRGRQLHRSSRALSNGTRPSLKIRRQKSQARQRQCCQPAKIVISAAINLFKFVFFSAGCVPTLLSCSSCYSSLHSIFGTDCFVLFPIFPVITVKLSFSMSLRY